MRRLSRIILFLCLALFLVGLVLPVQAAFQVPQTQGYVTDLAHVLSPETTARITAIAQELDQKTQTEIAVVTVDTLDGTPIEDASLQTARAWGVGGKQHNTGLLMFFAIRDHLLRTEVGYGLEGIITDGTTGEVRDKLFVPAFKQQNYDQGILDGTVFYAQKIAEADGVTLDSISGELQSTQDRMDSNRTQGGSGGMTVLILIILFLILMSRFRGGGFLPFLGGFYGGYYGGGGSGGGGSSGGGFGGFGGGSFGGGGSSGSW